MAAIPVTLDGMLYDLWAKTSQRVVIIAEASISGLGVGGGPMPPGGGQLPGAPPGTGIWPNPPEGQAPIVSHPIVLPGDPSWGPPPHVQHPIVLPPPNLPTEPPPEGVKPPPPGGGWGYSPEYGWGYFPAGGKPQPVP